MKNFFKGILLIPGSAKKSILVAVDSLLLVCALWFSFSLRLDNWYWPPGGLDNPIALLVLISPVLATPVFTHFGLYRVVIRYLGFKALWSIVQAIIMYAALWGLVVFFSGVEGVPRSVVLINFIIALFAIGGSRVFASWLLLKVENLVHINYGKVGTDAQKGVPHQSRVVIFGAGTAGRQLAVGLGQSHECVLLAFVDDKTELQNRDLMGLPVISQKKLQDFVDKHKVDDILLAIPSITRKQRSVIIERLRSLNVRIRNLPGLSAMAQGKIDYAGLHELDINDLLAREAAEPDEVMLQEQVFGKTVMVTGAGGSIGSELCRQILQLKPDALLLFELSEFALYALHNELLDALHYLTNESSNHGAIERAPTIIPLIGSVLDESRVRDVISTWKPNIIYHAAAVKHVPIVEKNIAECIKNNVLGTLVMANVAIECQVECFILVSTDKAVNPTNAMGASKRCCELILQALAAEQNPFAEISRATQFSMVRFGNVLGSSGSVVPHFRQQIAQGGPITLTHRDIIRYFMTIPEAAQLVIQAGAMSLAPGKGIKTGIGADISDYSKAEVYVLDMGEPVRILDLARRMIELSGFRVKDENSPEGDIAIEVIGLRPGEKLYEELLIGNNPQETEHLRIMKSNENFIPWTELQPIITKLRIAATNGDVIMIRSILQQLVPEYKPDQKVVDLVYKEKIAQADKL